MKVRVPILGTVGKAVMFDPEAGARAEAAVAALAAQISAGLGANVLHRNLQQLQVGDDHPQYAGNSFPETITGQWNFSTIPFIQGDTLAEYIEDVVGGSFFDFLQDTTSVVWTYHETANELEANVPPEFVQDVVGLMATDSTSVDFVYDDLTGTLLANVNVANPSGLIGMSAVNGTAATPLRSDGRHAIDPAIAPTWTGGHIFTGSPNAVTFSGLGPRNVWIETDQAANETTWLMRVNGKSFLIESAPDDLSASPDALNILRGTGTAIASISFGNAANNPTYNFLGTGATRLTSDNAELQLGASQDLRLYHNGTDSVIETDTGNLILRVNGELSLDEVTSSTSAGIGAATALPALPVGYVTVIINGTSRKIPYYAT